MKKRTIMGSVVAIVLIVIVGTGILSYNNLITTEETIVAAQANIDTVLQRRADLIPNLIASVNAFTQHETEIIAQVMTAREQLVAANTLSEKAGADKELTQALQGLMVVVEDYPELKSDTTYIALMDELAGSENRIAVARRDYNECVRSYNSGISKFPSNVMATMFGFEKVAYFEAVEEANKGIDVGTLLKVE